MRGHRGEPLFEGDMDKAMFEDGVLILEGPEGGAAFSPDSWDRVSWTK